MGSTDSPERDTERPAPPLTPARRRQKRVDMTVGPILPRIVQLAWPLVLANILQTVYNLADMFWVGQKLHSTSAVAAVGIVFPTAWVLISIGTGITIAIATFTAQYTGAKLHDRAGYYAAQGIMMSAGLGLVLAALGEAVRVPLLHLMGAQGDVFPLAFSYVSVIFVSVPFSYLFMAFASALRGSGDTFTAMKLMLVASLTNIVLDPFFITGIGPIPRWGIKGAAVATLLARILAASVGVFYLLEGSKGIRIRLSHFKPDLEVMREILFLGAPATADAAGRSFSSVAIMALVTRFGAVVTAAYAIGVRVMSVVWGVSGAIGQATNAGVGQNLGARQPARAEHVAWMSVGLAAALMTSVGFLAAIFAPSLVRFFINDAATIAEGTVYLRTYGWFIGFWGGLIVLQGAFRGAGRTGPAMALSYLDRWVIVLPLAYTLGYFLDRGPHAMWWAFPLADSVTFLVAAAWFKAGSWKKTLVQADAVRTRP